MYNQRTNPSATPSAQPPTYDVVIPSNPTKEVKPAKVTPERKPKQSAGALSEFIKEKELTLYQVLAITGGSLLGLKAILPDGELLKLVINPAFHTSVPALILYCSCKFEWKKGMVIGFLWLFVATPVALLIVR